MPNRHPVGWHPGWAAWRHALGFSRLIWAGPACPPPQVLERLQPSKLRVLRLVCRGWEAAACRVLRHMRPEAVVGKQLGRRFPALHSLDLSSCAMGVDFASPRMLRLQVGARCLVVCAPCGCVGVSPPGRAAAASVPRLALTAPRHAPLPAVAAA